MLVISVSDESPCRETSKSKSSAHLDMSVKNGERLIFRNYIDNLCSPCMFSNILISVKVRPKDLKFLP